VNKKENFIFFIALMFFCCCLVGCSDGNEYLARQKEELISEIAELEAEKALVKSEIVHTKEENGTAKYIVTFKIKQTHVSLNIGTHLKDEMNQITVEIPVDREYYDALSVGDVITDEFRIGSFVFQGTFGSWNITVENKIIV